MSGDEPYRSHRFVVDVEGLDRIGVAEVHGLSTSVGLRGKSDRPEDDVGFDVGDWLDPDDWGTLLGRDGPVGSDPPVPQRHTETPRLELTRGVTDDRRLWDWLAAWVEGRVKPRDVRVRLLDGDGDPARGWRCERATPVRWRGPDLVADRSGVAAETLELAHQGIEPIGGEDG